MRSSPLRRPEVHGHRGARALRPENTLPGLSYAIEFGVDAIEFDVTLAADGLIVAHDLVAAETTVLDTGPAVAGDPLFPYVGKRWSELTLAQIATLDAGDRRPREPYADTFVPVPGTPVPTLEQVCSLAVGGPGASGGGSGGAATAAGVLLAVELKTDPTWSDSDVRKLTESALDVLAAHGVAGRSRILAFDWRVLRVATAVAPDVPRVALIAPRSWVPGSLWLAGLEPAVYPAPDGSAALIGCAAAARDVGAAWLSPADEMVDEGLIAAAHREAMKVSVWTVNDPPRAAELAALGADAIVTDRPDLFLPSSKGHVAPTTPSGGSRCANDALASPLTDGIRDAGGRPDDQARPGDCRAHRG